MNIERLQKLIDMHTQLATDIHQFKDGAGAVSYDYEASKTALKSVAQAITADVNATKEST